MRIFYLLIFLSCCVKPFQAQSQWNNFVDTVWLADTHICMAGWETSVEILGSVYTMDQGFAYGCANGGYCDTLTAQKYFLHFPVRETKTIKICAGDSILIDSVYWSSNHTFHYPGMSQWGCDSILELKIAAPFDDTVTVYLVGDDSILIDGVWQSSSGLYSSTSPGGNCTQTFQVIAVPAEVGNASFTSSLWQSMLVSEGKEKVIDTETDKYGNLYVIAEVGDESKQMGPLGAEITDASKKGQQLIKYAANGSLLWRKNLPFYVTAIDISATDKIAMTGYFRGTVDFDLTESKTKMASAFYYSSYSMASNAFTTAGYQAPSDLFVVTYDLNAQLIWVKDFDSSRGLWGTGNGLNFMESFQTGADIGADVVFGLNDEVIVYVNMDNDEFDVDPDPNNQILHYRRDPELSLGPVFDRLIIALSPNGDYNWHQAPGRYRNAEYLDAYPKMVVDNQNNLLISFIEEGLNWNPPQMIFPDFKYYLQKLSVKRGSTLWSKKFFYITNYAERSHALNISIDHLDNIYVMGSLDYQLYPDPDDLSYSLLPLFGSGFSINTSNLFAENGSTWLGKYSPEGEHIWSFAQLETASEAASQYPITAAPGFDFEVIGNTIAVSGQTLRDFDIDPTQDEIHIEKSFPNDYSSGPQLNSNSNTDPNWDAYVALYSLDLEPIGAWVNGGGDDQGKPHLSRDLNGYMRVSGHFKNDVVLPPDSLETPISLGMGSTDIFYNSVYVDSSDVFATTFDTMYVCGNDSVEFNGQFFSGIGSHYAGIRLLNTFYYAHSYLELVEDTNALVPVYETEEICNGDSIFLGGAYQTTPGTYLDTVLVSGECDTLRTTYLTLAQPLLFFDTVNMCTGDSFYVGGAYQTESGTYVDSSLCSITQTLLQSSNQALNATISGPYPLVSSIVNASSFTWVDWKHDTIIPGANQSVYYPTYAGTFFVIVDSFGCTDSSDWIKVDPIMYNKTGGIVQEAYPTVIQQDYSIQFYQEETDISIDIFTVQGQLVWKAYFAKANGVNLNLNALAEGYYMVRVKTSRGVETLKAMRTLL